MGVPQTPISTMDATLLFPKRERVSKAFVSSTCLIIFPPVGNNLSPPACRYDWIVVVVGNDHMGVQNLHQLVPVAVELG